MVKGDKDIEAPEIPQPINGMDKDEMELVTTKLAREALDIRQQLDLPLDVGFVAQVPFIIGGIG